MALVFTGTAPSRRHSGPEGTAAPAAVSPRCQDGGHGAVGTFPAASHAAGRQGSHQDKNTTAPCLPWLISCDGAVRSVRWLFQIHILMFY